MSVETPSVEIKKEILKHQYSTSEEWAAEMASICLCSGFSEENDITVCCPRELVAQRLCEDARKSGKIFPLKEIEKIGRRGGSFYAVTFEKNSFLEFIEPFFDAGYHRGRYLRKRRRPPGDPARCFFGERLVFGSAEEKPHRDLVPHGRFRKAADPSFSRGEY